MFAHQLVATTKLRHRPTSFPAITIPGWSSPLKASGVSSASVAIDKQGEVGWQDTALIPTL
ncbi:hypothetical protein TIFTF001_032899 [Ficus carica]|uniref:Uncharacterized protein n=1 Tax=Ficus carica TaxID=3494 RepID=A0AA88DY86_FICCA|nr:hypothetical protein TIFTF001_032899 [Ficus carica]